MRPSRSADRSATMAGGLLMEVLEPRVLLDTSPFPTISDLVDPLNTVVRIETDFGDIDIELFDNSGPNGTPGLPLTVANFLNYIYDGDLDETFFHRLAFLDPPTNSMPFVLQGGGYRVNSMNELEEVPEDDPVVNEFGEIVLLTGAPVTVQPFGGSGGQIDFPFAVDLSGVTPGMWIRLPGLPTSASPFNTDLFEITLANDITDRIRFDTATSITATMTDWAVVPRVNVERSIAMAKLDGDPDSATSQFFINLADNSENLDNQNGGFAAFGRIATDAAWNVVQMIVGLTIENFVNPNEPLSGALSSTPVQPSHMTGDPISRDSVVDVIDIEVIKPFDTDQFYTQVAYFPEGYKGNTVRETLKLLNTTGLPSFYQVIVRYEQGGRDQVVATGMIDGSFHVDIPISDFNDPNVVNPLRDPIREATPFAYEVHATGTVAATLVHTDFGATIAEDFVIVTDVETAFGVGAALQWTFSGHDLFGAPVGSPGVTTMPFLVYQNTTEFTANLMVTFVKRDGGVVQTTRILEPHRRGGLEVFSFIGLETGLTAINVTSDQDVVASLSVYESRTSSEPVPTTTQDAYGVTGAPAGGHTIGVIAGARRGDGPQFLTLFNPGMTNAVVIVDIAQTGMGFSPVATIPVPANERRTIDLSSVPTSIFPDSGLATIRYRVVPSVVNVVGQFTATRDGDMYSTMFTPVASSQGAFADATFRPGEGITEFLSFYNPGIMDAEVRLVFNFGDSLRVSMDNLIVVPAGGRLDISFADLETTWMFSGIFATMTAEASYSLGWGTGDSTALLVASKTRIGPTGEAVLSLGVPLADLGLLDPGGGIGT